jgi:hypothetical protein
MHIAHLCLQPVDRKTDLTGNGRAATSGCVLPKEAHVTVRHGDLGVSPPIRERGRAFAPSVEVRQGASVRILPITSNEMLPR